MTGWEYEYDEDSDETIWYWGGEERSTSNGKPTSWKRGRPQGDHRDAIQESIQSAGTAERIGMQLDYTDSDFEER